MPVSLVPAGMPAPDTVRPTQVAVKTDQALRLVNVAEPAVTPPGKWLLPLEKPRLSPPASI